VKAGTRKPVVEGIVELLSFVSVSRKAKQRALYGKWTESFYSYDASLYDDYVTKSSQSHVDESALADSSGVIQRDSLVIYCVFCYIL